MAPHPPWTGGSLPPFSIRPPSPHPIRPSRRRGRGCHGPAVGAMVTVGIIKVTGLTAGQVRSHLPRAAAKPCALRGGGGGPDGRSSRQTSAAGSNLPRRKTSQRAEKMVYWSKLVGCGWPLDWLATGGRRAAGQDVGQTDRRFRFQAVSESGLMVECRAAGQMAGRRTKLGVIS
jgi:hypothetical protein